MLYPAEPLRDAMFTGRGGINSSVYLSASVNGAPSLAPTVTSLTVTRELAGDLPSDVTLLGGAVSASMDLDTDLRVSGPHAASAADRLLYLGTDITVKAGYNGYWANPPTNTIPLDVEVFTGVIREIGFDEVTNRRPVKAMEYSDRMRGPVTVPLFSSNASRMTPQAIRRYPTNLTAVLVAALHANDIRVTPAPSSDCVWSAPLVAGCLADVGWSTPTGPGVTEGGTWLATGPFGKMPNGSEMGVNGFPARRANVTKLAYQLDLWINTSISAGEVAFAQIHPTYGLLVERVSSTSIRASLTTPGGGGSYNLFGTVTMSGLTSGVHHVAARAVLGSNVQIQVKVDGGTTSSANTGQTYNYSASGESYLQTTFQLGSVQQVSLHSKTSTAASSWLTATEVTNGLANCPQADLDTALLEVLSLPPIDARVGWELAKEVASAELGMVGWSEKGRFYFKNRASINGTTTPVQTWGTDLVASLSGSASVDSIRDKVTVPVTKTWVLESGSGASTPASTAVPIHLHNEVLTIPAGVVSVIIKVARPMIPDASRLATLTSAPGPVLTNSSIVFCTNSGGSTIYTTALTSTIHYIDSTTFELIINNGSGSTKYVVWPTAWTDPTYAGGFFERDGGQGGLTFLGVVGDDAIATTKYVATSGSGDRHLQLPESPWRQEPYSAEALADELVADLSLARLQLDDIVIPADLRLQIGDPILLQDWAGRVPDITARITRIRTTIAQHLEHGMEQAVALRTLA